MDRPQFGSKHCEMPPHRSGGCVTASPLLFGLNRTESAVGSKIGNGRNTLQLLRSRIDPDISEVNRGRPKPQPRPRDRGCSRSLVLFRLPEAVFAEVTGRKHRPGVSGPGTVAAQAARNCRPTPRLPPPMPDPTPASGKAPPGCKSRRPTPAASRRRPMAAHYFVEYNLP